MGKYTTTDRDRVLMNIAVDTAGTVHNTIKRLDCGWQLRFSFEHPAPQFVPTELAETLGMPLEAGDIVRCNTNPDHRWGIAEFVERHGYSDFLLREIGGNGLCKMGNESIDVLRFMVPSRLYIGAKHRIYRWAVSKAFRKPYNPDADHFKRCGGIEFDGDTLVIWSRAHVWVMEKRPKNGPVLYAWPRKFTLTWNKDTKLKDIVNAMRDQGFAEDFDYRPEEPTQGQAGYAKITRDDLARTLASAGLTLKEPAQAQVQ